VSYHGLIRNMYVEDETLLSLELSKMKISTW
jgi:hypothetical protein